MSCGGLDSESRVVDTQDVTSEAPLPAIRASDEERDRIVRQLRERAVDGRLSHDSFIWRVERAMRARDRDELNDVVRDLPPEGRVTRVLTSAATSLSTMVTRVRAAWEAPQLMPLSLPALDGEHFTVGRASDCDVLMTDVSVSRRHAELRREHDDWVLVDLGSKNGTRINGLRIHAPYRVHPGDTVTFGSARFRLAARAA